MVSLASHMKEARIDEKYMEGAGVQKLVQKQQS